MCGPGIICGPDVMCGSGVIRGPGAMSGSRVIFGRGVIVAMTLFVTPLFEFAVYKITAQDYCPRPLLHPICVSHLVCWSISVSIQPLLFMI